MATSSVSSTTTSSSLPTSPSSSITDPTPDSPSTPRSHPTILNLPSTPSDVGCDSGPSTPMSCVSTIAIMDGHEGHRPVFDGTAERISRLSALSAGGYFDVNKRPDTPASDTGPGALAVALEESRRKKRLEGAAAESPASSVTTESAREQRREARLIDGMTYDEDVVDTTDRSPMVAGTPREEEKEVGGK